MNFPMLCSECQRLKNFYEVRLRERADYLDEYFAAVAVRDEGKVRELGWALAGAERLRTGAHEQLAAHEATHEGATYSSST
jgi:hypothetical protein